MFNKHKIEYLILKLFAGFFSILGVSISRRIAWGLGFVFFYIIPIRKKVIISNLSKAFPNKSEKEIKNLAYKNVVSTLITFIEFFSSLKFSEKELLSLAEIDEKCDTLLKSAINSDKGIILLTAHFGNWEGSALWVGFNYEHTLSVLVKPQSNPYVTEYIKKIRGNFGNKSVFTGTSVKDFFKILKNKGSVGIVGDQRGPKELRRVNFFGIPTAIYNGTATIALKTNSPIIALFFIRNKDYSYTIKCEQIICEYKDMNIEDASFAITQEYMNVLEKYVTQYPEQYFWMHNLWKY